MRIESFEDFSRQYKKEVALLATNFRSSYSTVSLKLLNAKFLLHIYSIYTYINIFVHYTNV